MKFLYFLTFVAIGIVGYLAYDKGQLASIHPLLDPKTHHGDSSETDVANAATEENNESEPPQPRSNSDDPGNSSTKETNPGPKPDPKQVRAEQAEQRRLKEEEKKLAREAQNAAYEAADKVYQEKKAVILAEIAELDRQNDDFGRQIKTAEQNRYDQERAWSAQKINNTKEQEKLRAASSQYIESLVAKQDAVLAQLQEKRREFSALRR